MEGMSHVELTFASLAGWGVAYFLVKHMTQQDPEWSVRVVTVLHAVLVTCLAAVDWALLHEWNIQQLGKPSTSYEELVLCITLGYFCFDFLWVLSYQTEGPTMYFHHLVSITSLVYLIAAGVSAREALVGISGLELTNPCLQARWFLRTHGYQGTWSHIITEIVFMILFIAFRIFYGTYLVYHIAISPQCHLFIKLGSMGMYMVSWIFMYQMINYIRKKYLRGFVKQEKVD